MYATVEARIKDSRAGPVLAIKKLPVILGIGTRPGMSYASMDSFHSAFKPQTPGFPRGPVWGGVGADGHFRASADEGTKVLKGTQDAHSGWLSACQCSRDDGSGVTAMTTWEKEPGIAVLSGVRPFGACSLQPGSFLTLRIQGPCCITDHSAGGNGRRQKSDWAREKENAGFLHASADESLQITRGLHTNRSIPGWRPIATWARYR